MISLDPYVGYQALLQRLLFVGHLLGDEYKAGEYVRGLAQLVAEERDRCAGFCTKAIAAGLAARPQVACTRREAGEIFATGIQAILDKLGLTPAQAAMVPQVIEATVLELSAG